MRRTLRNFSDTHVLTSIYLLTLWTNMCLSGSMYDTETLEARWGSSITRGATGFTAVPSVLIRYQHQLELSATELVVLLNVITHWWRAEELPYVRSTTISRRMGVDRRTVDRALQSLEQMGLLRRLAPESREGRTTIRRFDLTGLVGKLEQIADWHRANMREDGGS